MDQTSLLGRYPEPGQGEDAWVIYLQPRRSMSRTFREPCLLPVHRLNCFSVHIELDQD